MAMTMGLALGFTCLLSAESPSPPITQKQQKCFNEARYLFGALFMWASDLDGHYPASLEELLSTSWELDESLIYDKSPVTGRFQIAKWKYPNTPNPTQASKPDEMLFHSQIEGFEVRAYVGGRIALVDKNGKILKEGNISSFTDHFDYGKDLYPRLIFVIGTKRLSYYKNWDSKQVLNEIRNLSSSTIKSKDGKLVEFLSGILKNENDPYPTRTAISLKQDKTDWYFVKWESDHPNIKSNSHTVRVDTNNFPTPEKAVDWYLQEYLEPLLDQTGVK